MAKGTTVDTWWKNEFNFSDLIFFFFLNCKLKWDATMDVGVICTEGPLWSELSLIVPADTSVEVD